MRPWPRVGRLASEVTWLWSPEGAGTEGEEDGAGAARWASGRRRSVHVGLVGGVLPRGRCPGEDQVRQKEVHKPEDEKELVTSARRQLSVESGSWQSQ